MMTEAREKRCAHSLIYRMEKSLIDGNLEEAEQSAIDFLKSIRELKRIQTANENRKQLERIVQQLKDKGVLVERVKRIG